MIEWPADVFELAQKLDPEACRLMVARFMVHLGSTPAWTCDALSLLPDEVVRMSHDTPGVPPCDLVTDCKQWCQVKLTS